MELLSTVDWLLDKDTVEPDVASIRKRLASWPGGKTAAQRKLKLFEDVLSKSHYRHWQNQAWCLLRVNDDEAKGMEGVVNREGDQTR